MLIAGTTPLVMLTADTTHQGIEPSLMPTLVPPFKPKPDIRPPLLLHVGPVAHVDVYMDDFIGLAQGSQELCQDTRRCIMHSIDQIFAQPDERTPTRKELVSENKMNKGDGSWNQQKEILVWILDMHKGTMELTDWKKECVMQIFMELWDKKCIGVKKWHQVLGELHFMGAAVCFMGAAVPSAAGLFRVMQLGLTHSKKNCM